MFKVGDRVRFLNEEGGGIISGIVGPNMVNVSIEDGFEIPTLVSEIIKVDPEQGFYKHTGFVEESEDTPAINDTIEEGYSRTTELGRIPGTAKKQEGIYLAFFSCDQKWLLTGRMDIYLVNYTPYDILFSLFLKDEENGYTGQDYDGIQPWSKLLLKTIQREDTGKWSSGIIQAIFHKDKAREVLLPLHSNFRIREQRFLKEANYQDSPFIDGRSFLLQIGAVNSLVQEEITLEKKEVEAENTTAAEVKVESILQKHLMDDGFAEVDLHIEKLTDKPGEMDVHAKIQFQLAYFRECIDAGFTNDMDKMIFIHGIGKGSLRSKMMDYLKEFPNIKTLDADYRQYGMGAIEIRIRKGR